MRQIIKTLAPILRRTLTVAVPLTATLYLHRPTLYMDSRNLYDKLNEETLNAVDMNADTVFVLNLDEYVDEFKQKVMAALIELKDQNPNLRIYSVGVGVARQRPELLAAIDDRTVLLVKRKGDDRFTSMDLKTMYFDTGKLFTFYQDFPTVSDMKDLKLTKYDYLFGYCDNSDKGVRLFRELAMDESFRGNSFHIVNFDCEKVNGSVNDLFVLKKHSKVNSPDDNTVVTIDAKSFDYKKSRNFFNKDDNGSVDGLYTEIATIVDSMSVFTPIELHDRLSKNYSVKITLDENKISNREKFNILNNVKQVKNQMNQDLRKQINFYIAPGNLVDKKSEMLLTDELRFNLRASYSVERLARDVSQSLKQRYPFIDNDENTYTYKFDLDTDELSYPSFKAFFDRVQNNTEPQFYRSEPGKYNKVSEKLVFNTFQNIYTDSKDHIVMFYSKNCYSCKQIGPVFEQIAQVNLSQSYFGDLEFNRINGDLNSFFDHTPVIAYFKKGFKNPFIFNVDVFTLESLVEFISNTHALEIEPLGI